MLNTKKEWLWVITAAVALALLALWFVRPPMGLPQKPVGGLPTPAAVAQRFQTPALEQTYKLKKETSVLGMGVARIEHRQYPQEFVVLNGLGSDLVNDVFAPDFDPSFVEPLINQALKLKMPDKNVTLTLSDFETLSQTELAYRDRTLPARHVRITMQLSTEKEPRVYEGLIARDGADGAKTETVIVSFARVRNDGQKIAFDPKLLNGFLNAL